MFISTVFEGSMIDSKWITNGTEKEIKATIEYKCIKLIETKENSLDSKKFPKKVWPLKIKVSRISKLVHPTTSLVVMRLCVHTHTNYFGENYLNRHNIGGSKDFSTRPVERSLCGRE